MDPVWILVGNIRVASPPITQRLSTPIEKYNEEEEKNKMNSNTKKNNAMEQNRIE